VRDRRVAEQGDSSAQSSLVLLYDKGFGCGHGSSSTVAWENTTVATQSFSMNETTPRKGLDAETHR
jgi:hypothetical protein